MTMEDPSRADLQRALQDLRIDMENVTERIARSAGLNPRDLGVLDTLHARGPATPTELAERTGITATTLASALLRLQRGGHVQRTAHPTDGRSSVLTISADTARRLRELYAPFDSNLRGTVDRLPPGHGRVVLDFLHEVRASINEAPGSG